jgi:hypothetical protein
LRNLAMSLMGQKLKGSDGAMFSGLPPKADSDLRVNEYAP